MCRYARFSQAWSHNTLYPGLCTKLRTYFKGTVHVVKIIKIITFSLLNLGIGLGDKMNKIAHAVRDIPAE